MFLAAHAAPRRRRFFGTGGAPPPPTEIDRRAAAATMTSAHSSTVAEFHAEAPQTTASEGLTKGPYVAAKAGIEPMPLRTKGVDSTNASPTPLCMTNSNLSQNS